MAITSTTVAILTAVSTVVSVVGSIAAGQAAASQAKAQAEASARQSEAQAEISRQQAARETQVSAQQEEDFRKRQRRAAAAVRAAGGARGVDISVGSPLLSALDFTRETELQAQRIREGGVVRSTRLEQQASLLSARAGSTRAIGALESSAARTAGFLGAGASLLKGGTRVASILQD